MAKVIPLKKSRLNPKFKYALNEQVNSLPRSMELKYLLNHLATYGITKDRFYADRKILLESETSIPSDRLLIYAQVFDCPLQDLLNQPVKAKSIRQSNLKLKTSLR